MKAIDKNSPFSRKLYSVGKVTIDASFHTQSADEEFFRFFGNSVTYSIKRTVDENDLPRLKQCIAALVPHEIRNTVVRMKGIIDEPRWMLLSVRMLSSSAESEPLYTINVSDICSLEALSCEREHRLLEYRHILALISDISFEYSFETRKIRFFLFDCCREIDIICCDIDEWQRRSLDEGIVPQRYSENFSRLCSDIKNGIYRFDCELESSLLTDGKTREHCLFRGITLYDDPDTRKVIGTVSAISSRRKGKNVNLALESNRDPLSELLSKRAITDLAREIIAAEPSHNVNLVMIDIDDFTNVNNTYGHMFGDEVIYTIAKTVKNEIGSRGFAGRINGGGFLVVLDDTKDETDLRGVLRAIRTKTELAFADRYDNLRLTCSMGVSTYPIDSKNYDELFMQADKALYLAKEKGKNRYVIYDINKHGAVEKDIDNKIAFLSRRKDTSDKPAFLGDLADSLVFGRIPDLLVLLEQLRSLFLIDDVCVYSGNDMKPILSCGNVHPRNASYIFENAYTDRFSGDGIFVIDNIDELEGRDDSAMEHLRSEHIGGCVQYLITEDERIKGLISFCYVERFKKWSVMDTNYLTIAAKTVSAILRKLSYI